MAVKKVVPKTKAAAKAKVKPSPVKRAAKKTSKTSKTSTTSMTPKMMQKPIVRLRWIHLPTRASSIA